MRTTTVLHWALLIALFALPGVASAQVAAAPEIPEVDPYFVDSTDVSSDLGPRVITRNIIQDRTGNYWLATWSGVIHFDGTTFTNVTNKEGLHRYRVFSLLEDRGGNIWIGTVGAGVYRYDGETYTNFTTKDGLADNVVLSIMQDSDNNIWFGGHGVTKYDGTSFVSFTTEDGFTNSDVHAIDQSPDGKLWLGTRGALFTYDGTTFVNFTKERGVDIAPNSYTPVIIDQRGHVWFNGSNGLFHFDGETVKHVFQPESFSLMEDSLGNIWFTGGTVSGPSPERGTTVLHRFNPAEGIEDSLAAREQMVIGTGMIFGMTEDKDGGIWFGTGRGVGRIHQDRGGPDRAVQFFHK